MANNVLDVCASCGQMFARGGVVRLCAGCSLSDRARYELVRDHIRSHDGQTVADVARETGIGLGEIERYRSEGTLISRAAPASPPT